jgi:hypothetical protein
VFFGFHCEWGGMRAVVGEPSGHKCDSVALGLEVFGVDSFECLKVENNRLLVVNKANLSDLVVRQIVPQPVSGYQDDITAFKFDFLEVCFLWFVFDESINNESITIQLFGQ